MSEARPVCPHAHRGWDIPLPLDRILDPPGGWACPGIRLDGEVCGFVLGVAADAVGQLAARVEAMAENYPEDVFPADGTSRDAISGTAMRHAYRTAAQMIREAGR